MEPARGRREAEMINPTGFRFALLVALTGILSLAAQASASGKDQPVISNGASHGHAPYPNTFFDSDPKHPWNQLYGMLFIRPGLDGKLHGLDEMDALYWDNSRYLLDEPLHTETVALLDHFLDSKATRLIRDPLRRALLQRMLWALFDNLADHIDADNQPVYASGQRALAIRVVEIMRRVALTADEIRALPDNYKCEAMAQTYPADFDPDHPEQPFLPRAFFSKSDWVDLSVGAPVHDRSVAKRSTFHVLIHLPGGRSATLAYLDKLNVFEPHWLYDWSQVATPSQRQMFPTPPAFAGKPPWVNPRLPQVPLLTQFALVRMANLIDADGAAVYSPLVESIQIRVIRALDKGGDDAQAFEFLTLNQTNLMAGGCGLVALKPKDLSYDLVFAHMRINSGDPFEPQATPFPAGGAFDQLGDCFHCHSAGRGISTMNSYTQLFEEQTLRPPVLKEANLGPPGSVAFSHDRYEWGLLQAYWFGQN